MPCIIVQLETSASGLGAELKQVRLGIHMVCGATCSDIRLSRCCGANVAIIYKIMYSLLPHERD